MLIERQNVLEINAEKVASIKKSNRTHSRTAHYTPSILTYLIYTQKPKIKLNYFRGWLSVAAENIHFRGCFAHSCHAMWLCVRFRLSRNGSAIANKVKRWNNKICIKYSNDCVKIVCGALARAADCRKKNSLSSPKNSPGTNCICLPFFLASAALFQLSIET